MNRRILKGGGRNLLPRGCDPYRRQGIARRATANNW